MYINSIPNIMRKIVNSTLSHCIIISIIIKLCNYVTCILARIEAEGNGYLFKCFVVWISYLTQSDK